MRIVALLLVGASFALPAISDRAIRREAVAIGRIAQSEPPLLALDTLLDTACEMRAGAVFVSNRGNATGEGRHSDGCSVGTGSHDSGPIFRHATTFSARRSTVPLAARKADRGKIVVLNFWATWSGPCRTEMPVLGRVYDSLRQNGLEMFAITDGSAEHVRQFMPRNPVPIPVLIDRQRRVFEHHRITELPHTIVLYPSGRVLVHFEGEVSDQSLRNAIEEN